MENLTRIRRLSHALRVVIALTMAGLVALPPLAWMSPDWMRAHTDLADHIPADLALWQQVAGGAIGLGVGLCGVWMLGGLYRLFRLYGEGRIFEAENVAALRRFGLGLALYAVASTLGQTLSILVLTATAPVGQRVLSLSGDDGDVVALMLAVVFVVIARVMDEGRVLREDQQAIV